MSKNFQFLGFEATPTEKHRGIATIRILGEVVIVLRYKIIAKKDGAGFFPTCSAYKMPNRAEGDEYDDVFVIDSRTDNETLKKFIMHHVSPYLAQQPSVFAQSAQPLQHLSQQQAPPAYSQQQAAPEIQPYYNNPPQFPEQVSLFEQPPF